MPPQDSEGDKDASRPDGGGQDDVEDGSESGHDAGAFDVDGDLDINRNDEEKDERADGRGQLDVSAGARQASALSPPQNACRAC